MENKKILILANNSGGLYRFRKDLLQKLISLGNEVYASTPFDENVEDIRALGVHLIETKLSRRGMNPITDFGLLLNYFKMIKQMKPELVITYTIKPNLYGTLAASLLNVPYAINITGLGTAFQKDGLLKKMVTIWYRFVCQKVKIVYFENPGNKQVFIDNKIIDESKCCVLNGAGVDLEAFPFKEYPTINDKIHFLFIGRIMREKGVNELFEAITRLHKEGYPVVLDILGYYEDDYQQILDDLTSQGIVNYYGYQKDVLPFIEKAHCFVLPSYHEGMANTLLESASMGRPLITSNIHGCKEAVNNNGYLCNVQDSNDLYIKIKEFINLSYEDKKQLGINSRKHIEEVFDKKKVVEETIRRL